MLPGFFFVLFFFPPNRQAAVGKRGRSGRILLRVRSMPVFTWPVCLHVFVHTQDGGGGGGGGTGGFCWMSHIVPVRPGDIAGGQSGMEPERGDSDK